LRAKYEHCSTQRLKKLLFLTAIALILIFPIPALAEDIQYGPSDLNCKLEAYNLSLKKWSPGNIAGYSETEYIPVRLTIDNVPPGSTQTVVLKFDRQDSYGHLGIDGVMTGGSYYSLSAGKTFNFGMEGVELISAVYSISGDGRYGYLTLKFINTANKPKDAIFTFGAYLARGSHLWNGASLHIAIDNGCPGARDLPVMVNAIVYHEIEVRKESTSSSYFEGDTARFSIYVANNGNVAENLKITDLIPSGLSFIPSSAYPAPSATTVTPEGLMVEWDITIQPEQSVIITYQVRIEDISSSLPVQFTNLVRAYNDWVDVSTSLTITVYPVNHAPVARDDYAETDEDTSVTINVLSNDTDPDGDTLSVVSVSEPEHGRAVINEDGTITYIPDPNFSGYDSFTYTVEDEEGLRAEATVTVYVRPVIDYGRINGRVFLDENMNGVYGSGEGLLSGITVNLYDAEGNLLRSTITGPDGSYSFDNLEPGVYTISVELPLEYELTTDGEYTVELAENMNVTFDFGFTPAPVLPYTPEEPAIEVLPFTGLDSRVFYLFFLGTASILAGFALLKKLLS